MTNSHSKDPADIKPLQPTLLQAGDVLLLPPHLDANIYIRVGLAAGSFVNIMFTDEFADAYDGKPFVVIQAGPEADFGTKKKSTEDYSRHRLVLLPLNDSGIIATDGPLIVTDQWRKGCLDIVIRDKEEGSAYTESTGYEIVVRQSELVGAFVRDGLLDAIIRTAKGERDLADAALRKEIDLALTNTQQFLTELERAQDSSEHISKVDFETILRSIRERLETAAREVDLFGPILPRAIVKGQEVDALTVQLHSGLLTDPLPGSGKSLRLVQSDTHDLNSHSNYVNEGAIPEDDISFLNSGLLAFNANKEILNKGMPPYLDAEFMQRVQSLTTQNLSEENVSALAGWQRVPGEHLVIMKSYDDLVPPDFVGIRSQKNLALRDKVASSLLSAAPGHIPLGDRWAIASQLLNDGPSSFFSFFDAGEAAENHGTLFSFLILPTPAQNIQDDARGMYKLTGIQCESQSFDETQILNLETLIHVYHLSQQFKNYALDLGSDHNNRDPASLLERAAFASVNGVAAFLRMMGDNDAVLDYLHMEYLSSAMLAIDGEVTNHAPRMAAPFVADWIEQDTQNVTNPIPRLNADGVMAGYEEYAAQIWALGYRGRYIGMQRYEMAIKASKELMLKQENLLPFVRQVSMGVLTAANRFHPTLFNKLVGDASELADLVKGTRLLPHLPKSSAEVVEGYRADAT